MIRFASLSILAALAIASLAAPASAQYGGFGGFARQRVVVRVVNPYPVAQFAAPLCGQQVYGQAFAQQFGVQQVQQIGSACYGQLGVQQFAAPVVGGYGYGAAFAQRVVVGNQFHGGFGSLGFRAGFGDAPIRARVVIR